MSNLVEHLSWDAVGSRIANGASAILPIGAGAKEHGFHLPMNTDRVQAEALAKRLAQGIDALVWPTILYGYYPAFTAYAGSCSISAETFQATVEDIVRGLAAYGSKVVFVLNTGISTIEPVDRALARAAGVKALHLKPYHGARYTLSAQSIAQQHHGSHADELETSLLLALAPQWVDMTRAEASPVAAKDLPGPLTPTDTSSANYSLSGSFGDPTLATKAKGDILLAAITDDLLQTAKSFLAGLPAAAAKNMRAT